MHLVTTNESKLSTVLHGWNQTCFEAVCHTYRRWVENVIVNVWIKINEVRVVEHWFILKVHEG